MTTSLEHPSSSEPSISDLSSAMGLVLKPGDPAYSASVGEASDAESAGDAELDLEEFIDAPTENPELHRFKPAFYKNGWAKTLLVGGASLGVCMTGAATFKLMAPDSQVATEAEPEVEPETEPEQLALEQAQASESRTKAQLALQTQRQQMAQVAEFSEEKPEAGGNKAAQPKEPQVIKPAPSVTPVAAKAPPAPPTPVRAAPMAISPISKPVVRPVLQPDAVQPNAAIAATPSPAQPQIDPMAEWQRLATLGRYGTVTPAASPQFAEVAAVPEQAAPEQASSTIPTSPSPPVLTPRSKTAETVEVASVFEPAPGIGDGSGDVFQPEAPAESPELLVATKTYGGKEAAKTAKAQKSSFQTVETFPTMETSKLVVGTAAAAQTVTPILWAPEAIANDARFVISLSEPLSNHQGVQVLPSGIQLIVQATSIDPQSGLADLTVVSALIGGQEFVIPNGALTIRDATGGLLRGQALHRHGSTSHDIWRIAAGALGQAGQLMNQPRSTRRSSISTTGSSSISETIERGDPNYLGAALEGGFEALSEVMDARQRAAVQRLADAPQLYHLPAGQAVQVFVNQSFSF